MYIAMFMVTIKRMFLKVYSEQGSTLHNVGGNINWYNYYEEQYGDSLKKTKIELPYEPAIPYLGIHPEKTITRKGYIHPNVHHSTIDTSQSMEAT